MVIKSIEQGHLFKNIQVEINQNNGFICSTGLFKATSPFGPFTLVPYPNQPWADFYLAKIAPPIGMAPPISISTHNNAIFEMAESLNRTGTDEIMIGSQLSKIPIYPNPPTEIFN